MKPMNYMEQVAHLLGVELEEEFKIDSNSYTEGILFRFTEKGIKAKNDPYPSYTTLLEEILKGKVNIIKLPFKPKLDEKYWYWSLAWGEAVDVTWTDAVDDYKDWKLGNCFRTKEEAETKGKELMKSIIKEYENDN